MSQESFTIDMVLSSISITSEVTIKTLLKYWTTILSNTVGSDAFRERIEQVALPDGDAEATLSLSVTVAPIDKNQQ